MGALGCLPMRTADQITCKVGLRVISMFIAPRNILFLLEAFKLSSSRQQPRQAIPLLDCHKLKEPDSFCRITSLFLEFQLAYGVCRRCFSETLNLRRSLTWRFSHVLFHLYFTKNSRRGALVSCSYGLKFRKPFRDLRCTLSTSVMPFTRDRCHTWIADASCGPKQIVWRVRTLRDLSTLQISGITIRSSWLTW